MNETIAINISTGLSNAFYNTANTSEDSLTESISFILGKIVEVLTDTGKNYGFWKFLIVLFAIIGFFAVLSAIGSKILGGFGIIFKFCIVIPTIIIIGLINKKKRIERRKELKWLKEDFKKNSKKISKKIWTLWVTIRIIIPLALIIYLSYRYFV